jgi:hypothetical protein
MRVASTTDGLGPGAVCLAGAAGLTHSARARSQTDRRGGKPEIILILPSWGRDSSFASARHLGPEGCRMQQDEPFPRDAIPLRVRRAIIREFQGRRPTVQEVAQVSDRHWLATPDIGPAALETIHEMLRTRQGQGDTNSPRLTDAELLVRLDSVQEQFRRIHRTLEARMGGALPMRPRGRVDARPKVSCPLGELRDVGPGRPRLPGHGGRHARPPTAHRPSWTCPIIGDCRAEVFRTG